MSNELAIPLPAGTVQKYDSKQFDALAKSSDFLPRIQLYGGNSDAVKKRQIPMAHYGLAKDAEHIDDLGEELNCVPLTWRPKAMMISDKENPVNYHDPATKEFQDIVEQSEVKDSGCMYGPEFLMWCPDQKLFATMFFNSKTMRREAPNIRELMGKQITLKIKLIETREYSWHGPVTIANSSPLSNVPDPEELQKQVEKFINPPAPTVVKATEEQAKATKRAR